MRKKTTKKKSNRAEVGSIEADVKKGFAKFAARHGWAKPEGWRRMPIIHSDEL